MTTPIDRPAIEKTYALIKSHVRVTPVVELNGADFGLADFPLTLKLELFQHAGSFKTRGAFTNLLTRAIPAAGVVAASGGNHGAAVAYAAMRLRVKARIFVPTVSSPAKISRIRDYGADLVVTGDRYADALAASQAWTVESGALPVHAFDQEETLLGQGTLALELGRQAPDLDTLLVSVGGGGLIGGIAAWCGGRPRVIGVEPEVAPTLTPGARGGQTGGRPRRRRRGGFARPAPDRGADVPDRPGPHRARPAGERCGDPPGAGRALDHAAGGGRAGRRGRVLRAPEWRLRARAGRARRGGG
jgi:threonine dehydratase